MDKIYLVAIYDKSEMSSIEMKRIGQIIKKYNDDSSFKEL